MSFATMQTDIAAEMNRTNYTTADIERFLRLGQRFLERKYHPLFLKKTASVQTTGDAFALPGAGSTGGYFELLDFRVVDGSGNTALYQPSTENMVRTYRKHGMTPFVFWIANGNLYTAAYYTTTVTGYFTYIEDDALLTSTNTTNNWDTHAYDVLLAAACMMASRFDKDAERLKVNSDLAITLISDIEKQDARMRASYYPKTAALYGRG